LACTQKNRHVHTALSCMGAALGVFCALPCAAQTEHDPAAAQSLFDDAKRLMAQKDYAEACPKFAESQRLDPAGGTLIALGLCHEAWGKTASAWSEFNDALTHARQDNRPDRERAALSHIAALEKRLIRVRIIVSPTAPADLRVERDGVAVGRAEWSTPVAVDPGPHTFAASAANQQPWNWAVVFDKEGQSIDLKIPDLQPLPAAAPVAAVAAPSLAGAGPAPTPGSESPASAALPSTPDPMQTTGSNQTTWAWIAGGLGVGTVAVGSIFGASAISKWHSAEQACPGKQCTASADRDLGVSAGHAADLSTAFFAVGSAALATSAILFLTAPHANAEHAASAINVAPWLGPGNAGLGVSGSL
jgi:hypothetical protein